MNKSNKLFTCCVLSAFLISCSIANVTTINKDSNTIDMGYNSNNSTLLNIGVNSSFNTKSITSGFQSTLANIDHFEIAMSKSVTSPPSSIFTAGDAMIFTLNTNITSPRPIKILNLKPNTNYYIAARAFSTSGNITSIDGTASGAGGGTEGTINKGSGNEYINVASNGTLTIMNDGTAVKGGLNPAINNQIDIEIQLMQSVAGSVQSNSINYSAGIDLGSPGNVKPLENFSIINDKSMDFKVNTDNTSTNTKSKPDISGCSTGTNAGNFVVVWQSDNQDGSGAGIYGQLFDKNNQPIGTEFLVNQTTSGNQENPKVSMADDGSFVVVWQTNQLGNYDIYARRFQASGIPMTGSDGNEFRINTTPTNDQINPVIDSATNGDFAIAWQSNQTGDDNVYLKKYLSSGTAVIASDTIAHPPSVMVQRRPNIAIKKDTGECTVVWQDDRRGDGDDIYARRFDSSLVPLAGNLGNEFRVNSNASSAHGFPSVFYNNLAGTNPNDFCVVWYKNQPEIRFQYFDVTSGKRKDEEMIINESGRSYNNIDQAIDQNNNLTLSWGDSPSNNEIKLFQYDKNRKAIQKTDRTIFSASSTDLNNYSRIAFAKDRYVMTWVYNNNVKAKILYNQ